MREEHEGAAGRVLSDSHGLCLKTRSELTMKRAHWKLPGFLTMSAQVPGQPIWLNTAPAQSPPVEEYECDEC